MRSRDHGMLDDFGHAGRELTATQRLERRHIGDDSTRLLVQPDQVLALRDVQADLAADARVDHGDQVRRAVHEVENRGSTSRAAKPATSPMIESPSETIVAERSMLASSKASYTCCTAVRFF